MSTNIQANADQANVFADASSKATVETFRRLNRYKADGRWLGKKNVYGNNTIGQIASDRRSNSINEKHLAEYISASSVLHMADGWGFLGRAMQAHLVGDHSVARHLAYYAELRAAMALLACNGIGAFNNRHYVLTGPQSVSEIPGRITTHRFVWVALQWWAQSQGSWGLVGKAFRPYGISIADWLQFAPQYSSWGPVASNWITSLGLDIQRVADDQVSRNEASYRPNRIQQAARVTPPAEVAFAVDLWRSLEPGLSGFPNLDIHVLRLTLERAFESVEGARPGKSPQKLASMVTDVTSHFADQHTRDRVGKFLLRQTEPQDNPIFDYATSSSNSSTAGHHLEMMSRSALLLSLATSSCRLLVEDAGTSLDDHEFWWHALGADRGIWDTAPPSEDLRDLWEDINVELEDAEAWANRGNVSARSDFMMSCPHALSRLSHFELVALWGIPA